LILGGLHHPSIFRCPYLSFTLITLITTFVLIHRLVFLSSSLVRINIQLLFVLEVIYKYYCIGHYSFSSDQKDLGRRLLTLINPFIKIVSIRTWRMLASRKSLEGSPLILANQNKTTTNKTKTKRKTRYSKDEQGKNKYEVKIKKTRQKQRKR
jgi:hypothetical protein